MLATITALTSLLAGVWLIRLGKRGSFIGEDKHCPQCTYNLHGLCCNRCPECGEKVALEKIPIGLRKRHWFAIVIGSTCFILGVINSWPIVQQINVYSYLPFDALVVLADFGDDSGLKELGVQFNHGELDGGQQQRLAEVYLTNLEEASRSKSCSLCMHWYGKVGIHLEHSASENLQGVSSSQRKRVFDALIQTENLDLIVQNKSTVLVRLWCCSYSDFKLQWRNEQISVDGVVLRQDQFVITPSYSRSQQAWERQISMNTPLPGGTHTIRYDAELEVKRSRLQEGQLVSEWFGNVATERQMVIEPGS